MNDALSDSGALREERAANNKPANGWHKYYQLKWNETTGYARGYKASTGRDPISRERARYIKEFTAAVIVMYTKLQEQQQPIPPNLTLAYAHADGYKTFCRDRAVAAAERAAADQQLQDQMDEVEEHYGNQPQGTEVGQSSSRAASDLFRSPQAVQQAVQQAPSSARTPANTTMPANTAPGSGSSGSTSSRTPIPRFQDPIGAISGTRGDLGFLAQAIMSIGRSSDESRVSRNGTSTSNKRRKLMAKQEHVDSLWKRVANYRAANQPARIDATIRQIDEIELEVDQLHHEVANEMD
jgi:hypothetical protein